MSARLLLGDCRTLLPTLAAASVDAVISDPPYAEIDRPYGRLSEADWHTLMHDVVRECRRVLKPTGSAVFIVQPNSEKVGKLRPWVFDFVSWCCREWNVVQDAYWWNYVVLPSGGCKRDQGLMRASLKHCVWIGGPDCYRNQDAVLWETSPATLAQKLEDRAMKRMPSGANVRRGNVVQVAIERGGTTPFNVLPIENASHSAGGSLGHGASTPVRLCRFWVRYLTRPGDTVLDPFAGVGSVGIACEREGRSFLGIDKESAYVETAQRRLTRDAGMFAEVRSDA